jgi:hypothetical protein
LPLTNHVTTSSGEKLKVLPIRKGQIVNLAIASYQRFVSYPSGMRLELR